MKKSAKDTEERIAQFLKWLHKETTTGTPDERGFIVFESLSTYIEQDYGMRMGHLLPALVKHQVIETDYTTSKKLVGIKWACSVDITKEEKLYALAMSIRLSLQVLRRTAKGETIPQHLSGPITEVSVTGPEKEPEPSSDIVTEKKKFIIYLIEKAVADGCIIEVNIPRYGINILSN